MEGFEDTVKQKATVQKIKKRGNKQKNAKGNYRK